MSEFAAVTVLSTLDGDDGFRIIGKTPQAFGGLVVSGAGDINGDGFADIISSEGTNVAHVVFGSNAGFAPSLSLAALDAADGFQVTGCLIVSAAGDVNGDGIDDFIVGAPSIDTTGAAYVVFGKTGGFGTNIDLSALDGSDGFRISGIAKDDRTGIAISSAGDLNGDGFDDLLIGAPNYDINGAASVVFGHGGKFASNIELSALDGDNGFRLRGGHKSQSGYSVASIGDMNGDGFDDIVIGASHTDKNPFDTTEEDQGAAYVFFGKAGGFSEMSEFLDATLDGANGFRFKGDLGNLLGSSVASAGDVNGDGLDDVIIGAVGTQNGAFTVGAAYVIFGRTTPYPSAIDLSDINSGIGYRISGSGSNLRIGISAASAGDVNGDGFDDVIVGTQTGKAYVMFGRAGLPPSNTDVSSLKGETGFEISGAAGKYDNAGHSVSSAGDLNGDGFDDLVVGAPGFGFPGDADTEGDTYVIFGHRAQEAVVRFGTNIGQTINGGVGNDQIAGFGGNDTLKGWEGRDTISGGSGDDVYVLEDIFLGKGKSERFYDTITENANEGIDTVKVLALDNHLFGTDGYELGANFENGVITGTRDFALQGNELDNSLTGNAGLNMLSGEAGNDSLNGAAGLDSLLGGLGNDVYTLGDISASGPSRVFDTVVELANEGIDTIRVRGFNINPSGAELYDLAANVENGVIIGALNFGLRGNALGNHLTGNAHVNQLSGLAGNDTITGGLGRDLLRGGGGIDIFDFNAIAESGKTAGTRDAILDFTVNSDRIDLFNIDAVPGGGNNAFAFIGDSAFSKPGQLRVEQSGSDTVVEINTLGASGAEMTILLGGVSSATIDPGDFRL